MRKPLVVFLGLTWSILCAWCTNDPGGTPRYDRENAIDNVTIVVDGEGFPSEWHMEGAGSLDWRRPNENMSFVLERDACEGAPYPDNSDFKIHGLYNPDTDLIEFDFIAYSTLEECAAPDFVVETADLSGRLLYSVDERRIRLIFEDFRIDLLSPVPPPGTPVIRSITLNGEYRIPAF